MNDHNPHSAEFELSLGPLDHVLRYTAYMSMVLSFAPSHEIVDCDPKLGVYGTFGTRGVMRQQWRNMRFGDVPYYGKPLDVIGISYTSLFTVTLFKCLWRIPQRPGTHDRRLRDHIGEFLPPIHGGRSEDDEPYILASRPIEFIMWPMRGTRIGIWWFI
ncbi:hypothetical protein K1719_043064 [Acacia pycnantha]|nr:hypothetical protein K1719_043064 [Acacia pycnantha]